MTKIKLSDYVIKFISSIGVKHVFLLPGGGCMHLVDSLGKNKELEPICCLHEQSVAICADAYSQYNNNIGVALVTTGPGGTNAITGVVASWIDSTPVLIISGQVKTSDMKKNISDELRQMGNQEVDIIKIVDSFTKYAVTITNPKDIKYNLEKALWISKEGRPGPVWIDIPLDVQSAIIDEDKLFGFTGDTVYFDFTKKEVEQKVLRVIELLNESERPVILVGNGVRLSGGEKEFLELIELLRIPVLTTWRTIDFLSEDHELYFGRPGSIGQRGANFIQQNCDLIITIGTRLDLTQVGYNYKNFARGAKKVIVDIDAAEIKKMSMYIDVPICIDAKIFIQEMLNNLCHNVCYKDRSEWILWCKVIKNKYPVILPEYLDESSKYVNIYALINDLSELMTENDVLVPGSSGSCAEITMQSFKVKKGQRIINNPGLGSMGFGLPASIGVGLASEKRVICIIGDGGLQHNIQELETLKRLNLPVKVFVLNNNGYASIRNTHNKFFDGRLVCCDPSSGLTLPDTCKIAYAYGLNYGKILNHRNLKENVKVILDTYGSVICEVMINPDLQTSPKLSSYIKSDGSIASKPMEDLYPFLDREEFKENMIIENLVK